MTQVFRTAWLTTSLFASIVAIGPVFAQPGNWPQFRGPDARGVADGHALPSTWNAETSTGVLWKTPIPGLGHLCPVVWGDRLFVTTAITGKKEAELKVGRYGDIKAVDDSTEHVWRVYSLDKLTGKTIWDREVHRGVPAIQRHTKASHANSTPATDGEHLVVMLGSEGLHCFDLEGKLLWKKDLGVLDSGFFRMPEAQWGFGSSPVIYEGHVVVQADVQKNSYVAVFDVNDGREVWRTARNDVPSWSTPVVHAGPRRTQVIVNGFKHIGGYDFATGKELWKLSGGGDIPIPTPILGDGLVYFSSSHGGQAPLFAVKLDATGDISLSGEATSNEYVAWSYSRTGAYMPTPVLYGDHFYVCRDNGILSCYDAKTGERLYQERLGSGVAMTASSVAGDGKLYFTGEMGDVYVVKAGPEFELLSKSPLGEVILATPAISEGVLYFRNQGHVVAVGGPPSTPDDS